MTQFYNGFFNSIDALQEKPQEFITNGDDYISYTKIGRATPKGQMPNAFFAMTMWHVDQTIVRYLNSVPVNIYVCCRIKILKSFV